MLLVRNEDLRPALIVVKSGLRAQWFAELLRWSDAELIAQVIESSRELPDVDMFDVVIVSLDTLRLVRPDVNKPTDRQLEEWKFAGDKRADRSYEPIWSDELCAKFKHICVDEGHLIKNDGSSRTKALRTIVGAAERLGQDRPRVVIMSGTQIEKHAGEYFVPLNLVRPEMFNNKERFERWECDHHPVTGKILGLRDPEGFKAKTSDFIIRRLRKDVLPDLPKVFRQFRLAEIKGEDLNSYVSIVKKFQELMNSEARKTPQDILGYLTHMRHITGVAKTEACVEFVEEFLNEAGDSEYEVFDEENGNGVKRITAGRKLVVFLHHINAGVVVMQKVENICKYGTPNPKPGAEVLNLYEPPLYLNAQVPAMDRQKMIEEFKNPGRRVMVASSMVAAEGLNMQFVSDMVMMERQWNPSKEEQCEGRFPRPGSLAAAINAVYLIAAGTVDDFLTKIVEQKRANVANTLDGGEISWDQDSLMNELAEVIRVRGLKQWGL
jgi:SNF2 family DNA or RNA helicase